MAALYLRAIARSDARRRRERLIDARAALRDADGFKEHLRNISNDGAKISGR